MNVPARVAILGAGEIGSGWAALFAAHGAAVRLVDPARQAIARAQNALDCARRIGLGSGDGGSIRISRSLDDALDGVSWVVEALPESLALKRGALEAVEPLLAADAIVASSSSSILPDAMIEGRAFADRFLVAHPLQPVYAVPIVELQAGTRTASSTVDLAAATLRLLGREPILIRAPVAGMVSNRLTAALLREAFDLVATGAISADDLDAIVRRGLATGWLAAGVLGTEAIGAGEAGLAGFIERFSEPLGDLWSALASWTSLDEPRRHALVAAVSEMKKAHDAGECAWAETLARVLRATEGSADA